MENKLFLEQVIYVHSLFLL